MRYTAAVRVLLALGIAATACSPTTEVVGPRGHVRTFVDSAVTLLQTYSLRKDSIDWVAFRAQVLEAADGAATIEAAMPSMSLALTLLGDNHSWLRQPNGTHISYPRTRSCVYSESPTPELPGDIGYVRVPAYGGTSELSAAYTGAIQDALRDQDADSLAGWIIDLRGNTGGNMWPMLAALWPFLQDVVGHFRNSYGFWSEWRVVLNSSYNGPFLSATAANPHYLESADRRVAVWTNGMVASSGEATAIAFKQRPATRSFGSQSCGLSTGVTGFPLPSGYLLGVTRSVMADRDSVLYGDFVVPDEVILDNDELLTRTIAWLRTGI